ncbi:ankyrin repeat and SOCS box protein 10 [Rhineura floridana]|uniref:ankyrin repeat and SOCS box protein 10 n=1 Tax=Rhineura floridana TaxID=261503 RepID=UPI002AC8344A|nr:ankyrin repeat and SOCS box protein 10 [Rhineura floridana]
MEPIATRKAQGPAQAFWRALLSGDGCAILCLLGDPESGVGPNSVFDTSDLDEWKSYRSNVRWLRIWSLTYEQELTTPLHITASRGYLDCLRHLLLRGADVDLAPGGQTALHEACAAATTDCARLLLSFGADPQAASEGGFQPLHLCRSRASLECAQLLLRHGANVNGASKEEGDTPLHVAARLGLAEHVRVFLRHGANLEAQNAEGQTPLNAACAQPHPPRAIGNYYDVCRELVDAGARVDAADVDRQRPLHQACKTANSRVVALLLARGASVNIMSYSGNTALHNILQAAAYKLEHRPEVVVRDLLNHGAVRVWPGALLKVLRHCYASPRTIEALVNCYKHVPVTEEWAEAVPAELTQQHQRFFQSLFSLGQSPRALQHLARCTLRNYLEGRLIQVLPGLHLPPALHDFLLLRFEDVMY